MGERDAEYREVILHRICMDLARFKVALKSENKTAVANRICCVLSTSEQVNLV